MPYVQVAAFDHPALAPYRDLPRKNLTALSGRFIVEGKWLVERLASSQYWVESVVVDAARTELLPDNLPEATPIYAIPYQDVERLIGFQFHRGILACGLRRPLLPAAEVVPETGSAVVVVCWDIQDPTNLGGILRNCAAFGVQGVLLSRGCADPFSRRVLRVSMGTAFRLRMGRIIEPLSDLKQLNLELVATVLAADAERLNDAGRPQRLALLIGNEGHGLPVNCLEYCDRRITLPMPPGVDSLNAAAASAVFLYHFTQIASVK